MVEEVYNNIVFPESFAHLRGMLVHCGHMCATCHSYVWDGMKRGNQEMTIWQYTLSGVGELRIGRRVWRLEPGMAMLLTVPEEHCYRLPEDSGQWEFLYVSVSGSELMRIFSEFRRIHGSVCSFASDARVVDSAWDVIHRCRDREIRDCYSASSAAYDFIMSLCASTDGPGFNRDYALLNLIQEYCLDNLDKPLTVDDLARVAGCSRWHFSRRFQQVSGSTPHDFVLDLKMRKALRLLASPAPVKEIAFACGFDSLGYFCKVFRRIYGMSPGAFRRGDPVDVDQDSL